jgi:hypothetical protein
MEMVVSNTPYPMGVISTHLQWFLGITDIPEFNATVIATCDKVILLVWVEIHVSYLFLVSIINRPTHPKKQTIRQADRQTDRHIYRQANTYCIFLRSQPFTATSTAVATWLQD